jgi:hypothetical protein
VTKKKLSPVMQQLIDSMRADGGTVARHPGGFWYPTAKGATWYGTSTVEAIVARGAAEYSKWQEGRNGRFPIEARLVGAK